MVETTVSSDGMAAREISLRDYLAGHVLRSAMLHFEQAVGPWVKVKVLAHFGASADEDSLAQEHAARVAGLKKETADLESEQATLKKVRTPGAPPSPAFGTVLSQHGALCVCLWISSGV